MSARTEWEKVMAHQDEANRLRELTVDARVNAIPRPVGRTERWFQTFIQALFFAACGFTLWAVCC